MYIQAPPWSEISVKKRELGQATLKGRFCSIAWVEWNGQHQVVMLDQCLYEDMLKRNQGTKNPGKISSNFLSSHAKSCKCPESSHIGGVVFCNKWDDRSFQQEHQCVFVSNCQIAPSMTWGKWMEMKCSSSKHVPNFSTLTTHLGH